LLLACLVHLRSTFYFAYEELDWSGVDLLYYPYTGDIDCRHLHTRGRHARITNCEPGRTGKKNAQYFLATCAMQTKFLKFAARYWLKDKLLAGKVSG
jgi:hypothetical protein